MRASTVQKMTTEYGAIRGRTKATALKYHYEYNGVHINIYFDAYDPECLAMSIVFALVDNCNEKQYFLQEFNVHEDGWHNRYLIHPPMDILHRLLNQDNQLVDFWESVDQYISGNRGIVISDKRNDIYYRNTLNIQTKKGNKAIGAYLLTLRRVNMTEEHFNDLRNCLGISRNILLKIRDAGYTLVTTDDPMRRASVRAILNNI